MRLLLLTPPVSEPLSLDEAKGHLRVEHSQEDAYISALITAAREMVENYTNRQLMEATFELVADELTDMTLPKPPLKDVVSVEYTNNSGVLDIVPFTLLEGSEPAQVQVTIPADYKATKNGVRLRFTAGYATVPASLKAAMLLLIGHLYENREETIVGVQVSQLPKASEYLMNPYRVMTF